MRVRGSVTSARYAAPLACLLAVLVAGCAIPAAPPALNDAHAAVERARSSPRVRALAPAELDLAEIALEQAGAAARAGAPRAQVEHLAYVASQRAALAEARAAAQVARSETRLLRRSLDRASLAPPSNDPPKTTGPSKPRLARAPVEQDRPEHAPGKDRKESAAAPDPVAAEAEAMPREVTLRLAELPYEEAGPTGEALDQLAALAERLAREPGLSLLIEADFDLPDPEARTVMERRVEVVRAFFLERGVAPARLLVRAGENGPAEPQATSAFVEPPE